MASLAFKGLVGKLPTSEFDLMEGDVKIGFLQIRHRPSRAEGLPERMASHVYYEIDPAWRGKGHGKEILRLGLGEARNIGLREVILTCNEENVASRKIIEANGGMLVDDSARPSTEKRFLKFIIALSK